MPRQHERKGKNLLFTGLILFVLVSSIVGFTFSAMPYNSQPTNLKYGNVEFFPTQTGVAATIEDQTIEFFYLPEDVAGLQVADAAQKLRSAKMAYATSDVNSSLASAISGAQFDIARVLEKEGGFLEVAFTSSNPYGKKVVTCADATPLIPVLFFTVVNSTSRADVTSDNNCLIVTVDSEYSLYKVRDRIIYDLAGIAPRQ